jgi:copper chaperone CopZ
LRAAAAAEEDDEPWEIDLQVTGMVCDGCSSNVKNTLAAAKGVSGVEVDLAAGVATVQVQAENAVREHAQLSRVCGGHPLTRSAQVDAVRVAGELAAAVKAAGFECSPIL